MLLPRESDRSRLPLERLFLTCGPLFAGCAILMSFTQTSFKLALTHVSRSRTSFESTSEQDFEPTFDSRLLCRNWRWLSSGLSAAASSATDKRCTPKLSINRLMKSLVVDAIDLLAWRSCRSARSTLSNASLLPIFPVGAAYRCLQNVRKMHFRK